MTTDTTPATVTSLIERLETGDLVFFHGTSSLSHLIEWAQGSRWSHVALAVRLPSTGHVLLWESERTPGRLSTYDAKALYAAECAHHRHETLPEFLRQSPPAVAGSLACAARPPQAGVRFVGAREKLQAYSRDDATVVLGVRRLSHVEVDGGARTRRILAAAAKLDGVPYPAHLGTLVLSWFDLCDAVGWSWNGNVAEAQYAQTGLFCSELAVVTLAAAGIVHLPHQPGARVPPADRQTVASECTVEDLCCPTHFDEPLLAGGPARYARVVAYSVQRGVGSV